MELFSLGTFLVSTGLLGFVGVRLLLVAWRTHEAPETAMGLACVPSALGFTMIVVGLRQADAAWAHAVWAAGVLLMATSSAFMAVGLERIYRRGSVAARTLAGAVALGTALGAFYRVGHGEIIFSRQEILGTALSTGASTAVYLWAATESFVYWRKMRRRLAIGLADPMIAAQFGLWGVSATSALVASAWAGWVMLVQQAVLTRTVVPFMGVQALLAISSVGLWLAFFPPEFVRRHIRGGAASSV